MKLRPEQRKLWRRIYLTAFEGGATSKEATYEADVAVHQWEERGAFEADVPMHESVARNIVSSTLHRNFPDAFAAIYAAYRATELQAFYGKPVAEIGTKEVLVFANLHGEMSAMPTAQ